MAYLSPGVYIKEVDASAIVPTVSNSVAFFAGTFQKGVIEQPFLVTNKDDLVRYFGEPDDDNYNEWYQASKFLDYGNQLVISRAWTEGDFSDPTMATQMEVQAASTGALSPTNNTIEVTSIDGIYPGLSFWVGDTNTAKWTVLSITAVGSHYQLTVDGESTTSYVAGDSIYGYLKHVNSEMEAIKGTIEPELPYNIPYQLTKNKEDFEVKKENSDYPFYHSLGKLKFIGRTAEDLNLNVAICNYEDFQNADDGKNTKAQAFMGESIENFFQYPPVNDTQVGIIIEDSKTGLTESYIVSFDEMAIDGNGKSMYVENVINDNSSLCYVIDNKSMSDGVDSYLYSDRNGDISDDSIGTAVHEPLIVSGGAAPKVDPEGDIYDAYFEVENKELYEIDIVIGNELNQNAAVTLADTRADCIAFIGARYEDTVGKRAAEATQLLIDYIKGNVELTRTMFAAFFGNYIRIYDNYNKKFRWVNIAGDAAGLRADTNTNQAAWWASAGLKRGVLRNINKIAFTPDQSQRDALYKNSINPVVNFPGEGIVVWGQKTLLNYASAFDRVNVRSLFNVLERAMAKAARSQVFEFNDPYTRNAILSMFNPFLASVKAGRGISDYLVVCDTTNNTPDVISRNELHVDIYIKPMYAAEFIVLTFTNVGTRSFAEVISGA